MNRIGRHLTRFGVLYGAALMCSPAGLADRIEMQQQAVFVGGRQQVIWNNGGMMVVPGGQQNNDPHLIDGFSVSAGGTDIQDTPAGEAINLMQSGDWLKAIEAIEKLDSEDQQMVTDPNGVLRPLSTLKSALIASMPEEGKRTFRRLNDPAARTLLEETRNLTGLTEREKAYQTLVNDYALCDASAQAGSALGDIRFEQGRFDEAAALYRFSAEHPGSTSDDPMLMAKRLIALSRAGQWKLFDALVEYAAFRHPETPVTLGGESITISELIKKLSESRDARAENQPDKKPSRSIGLPGLEYAIFKQTLVDPNKREELQQFAARQRVDQVIDDVTAPVVLAEKGAVYTLALSSVARLDPETGSELWRTGDPETNLDNMKRSSSRIRYLHRGYSQSLTLTDDTLLCVVPDPDYPNRSRLVARNAETGEVRWQGHETANDLNNNSVIGRPLVVDDVVYVIAQNPGEPQIRLVSLSLRTGAHLKTLQLGAAANNQNLGAPAELSPRLAMGRGYLFVQTNNGALIAVEPSDLSIAWAFTQRIRPSGMGNVRNRGGFNPDSISTYTGSVVTHEGVVYAKDTRSNKLHALREYDAAPLWIAQTDDDGTIVHQDERFVYVLGGYVDSNDGTSQDNVNLVAHDLRTGEAVWWSRLAGVEAGTPVFTDDACFIAGSSRVCRIDLKTGKLTDMSEHLLDPASLSIIDDKLIHVTQNHVSAFRLPEPVEPKD